MTEKDNKIQINDQFADEMLQVWRKYNEAKDTNSLLLILSQQLINIYIL